MNLDMVLGFFAGLGLYTGVRTIVEVSKKLGIIQLVLTFFAPILTSFWCTKKSAFAFKGTDFEFLIHTATVDKNIIPWLIFILYLFLTILIIYNIVKIIKKNKS